MNKKILTIIILAIALCMSIAFVRPVMAEEDPGKDSSSDTSVASVNNKYYDRLDDAFKFAPDGATVKLEKSLTVPTEGGDNGYVTFNREGITIIFDMNGCDITSSSSKHQTFEVKNGTLTIRNSKTSGGIIEHTGSKLPIVIEKGTVTLESGVTIKNTCSTRQVGAVQVGRPGHENATLILNGAKVEGERCGINLFGKAASLNVKSGEIFAKEYAIAGNGNQESRDTRLYSNNK